MQALLESRLGELIPLAILAIAGLCALVPLGRILLRYAPIADAITPSRRSLLTDLGYLLLGPVTDVLTKTLTSLGFALCAVMLGDRVGPDLMTGFGPVIEQPRWLVLAEMLVVGDLIYYWTHRWAHEVPWLWRFHAVHHCTEHMRWCSSLRSHPAEAYVLVVNHIPLFLLGFPVDALVPLMPLVTLYAMWIHCDVDVALRRVSYLFNSPNFHGWHHALEVEAHGTNFAGLFPVFDVLFGSYRLPDRRPGVVGIDDPNMPATLVGQLAYPVAEGSRAIGKALGQLGAQVGSGSILEPTRKLGA